MRSENQITGNIGLYYCCYRLSLLGWNVMPTSRNARGVDILAYSQDATKKVAIQIKALSYPNSVPLGSSLDKVMGDFWIIVNNVATSPSAFIMVPSEIKERAGRTDKNNQIRYWLVRDDYDQDCFKDKWDRIGHGNPQKA